MKNMKYHLGLCSAGLLAGALNGIYGGGGGIILVPALRIFTDLTGHRLFSTSIAVMLITSIATLIKIPAPLPLTEVSPYLLGGTIGGIIAGKSEGKIPVLWLHRILGILILWGGIRYLC